MRATGIILAVIAAATAAWLFGLAVVLAVAYLAATPINGVHVLAAIFVVWAFFFVVARLRIRRAMDRRVI